MTAPDETRDPEPDTSEAQSIRPRLDPFFTTNPASQFKEQGGVLYIVRPWNDPTVRISVARDNDDLIAALNSVFLPPPLCALWHTDTKDLEFVWQFISLDKDLEDRACVINYEGKTVRCEWSDPSDRLLSIADATKPAAFTSDLSDYRNIPQFQRGRKYQREHPDANLEELSRPLSFWIRGVDWDHDFVVRMCRHINFYMRYYDTETPMVVIVDDLPKSKEFELTRYPHGTFPSDLNLRTINSPVLDLWFTAATMDDPFRQFLHSYQVLEYFAHYYVTDKVKEEVRRILIKPDAISRIDNVTSQIIDVMTPTNNEDRVKLSNMMKDCIDPVVLWPIVDLNRDFFSKTIKFDGDFVLESLVGQNEQEADFVKAWPENFIKRLETLRNALAHAREKRHSTGISPTSANHQRLQPWAILTLRVAEQAVIYHK